MKIDAKGISGSSLSLGIQSNPENFLKDVILRAKYWAPKETKSFTIDKVLHTDYYGIQQDEITGYATIIVSYYSTKKEGKTLFEKNIKKRKLTNGQLRLAKKR